MLRNKSATKKHPGGNRAFVYLRVSTAKQAQGEVSIPSQRLLCREHCDQRGYSVIGEYTDSVSAHTDVERPGFRRMIECAKEGGCDIIVVHSMSRFYRNGPVSELTIRDLVKHGVRVESVTQTIGDDPSAVVFRQVVGAFDEYQSLQSGINVVRGMNENARQGFWNGARPPLGYRTYVAERRGAKLKKKLEPDPVESETLCLIFQLYDVGVGESGPLGIAGIVDYLYDNGYTTRLGARFGKGQIGQILRSAFYATGLYPYGAVDRKTGEVRSDEEIIYIEIPPLISRDQFDRVQARLTANNPHNTPPRVTNGPSLLTGLARCERCGSSMTRTGTQRHGVHYAYYTCAGAHSTGARECRGRHVKAERLDSLVLSAVRERLLQPDALMRVLSDLAERQQRANENFSGRLARLEQTCAEATTKLDRLYALVEGGEADDLLTERITRLRNERERARQALAKLKAQAAPQVVVDAEMAVQFSALLGDKLANADVQAKKAYLRSIIDRIEVGDAKVQILGQKSTLRDAMAGRPTSVRGFDREWRARKDSNL